MKRHKPRTGADLAARQSRPGRIDAKRAVSLFLGWLPHAVGGYITTGHEARAACPRLPLDPEDVRPSPQPLSPTPTSRADPRAPARPRPLLDVMPININPDGTQHRDRFRRSDQDVVGHGQS